MRAVVVSLDLLKKVHLIPEQTETRVLGYYYLNELSEELLWEIEL